MGPWEIIGWIILGTIFINLLPAILGLGIIVALVIAPIALFFYSPILGILAFIALCIYGHIERCNECDEHMKDKRFYNCIKSFFTPSHHKEEAVE
jgi:hypothetical protein